MFIRQLSIFVETKKGGLAEILTEIGNNNIDICALSLADTTDFGILRLIVDDEDKDFTHDVDENVFALSGAVIVPQSRYTAEMKITNNSDVAKSDVAFAYWVEIVYTGVSGVDLAEQINVTVNTDNSKRLNEGLVVGSESEPIGVLAVGESGEFSVTIEFLNLAEAINNGAQGDEVTFDLVVHAVQYTGPDTDQGNSRQFTN